MITTYATNHYSNDEASIYTHEQLCKLARITHAYTVYDHDFNKVILQEHQVLTEHFANSKEKNEQLFLVNKNDVDELYRVLSDYDDSYILDEKAKLHLDDVYKLLENVRLLALIMALVSIGVAFGVYQAYGLHTLLQIFFYAGATTLALFLISACLALVNFSSFFNILHSAFFNNGSWIFKPTSLLICMFPEKFWITLGIFWISTSVAMAILCMAMTRYIMKRQKKNKT